MYMCINIFYYFNVVCFVSEIWVGILRYVYGMLY